MENKEEKFFVVLDRLDETNLQILLFVANEIDGQLQRKPDGPIELTKMPSGFRCRTEYINPEAAFNIFERKNELEKDRNWALELLTELHGIKSFKYREDNIFIEATKKALDPILGKIFEKYDNVITSENRPDFEYKNGVLYHFGKTLIRTQKEKTKKLFETLWKNRRIVEKNQIVELEGNYILSRELLEKTLFDTGKELMDTIGRFRKKLDGTGMQIEHIVDKGYLLIQNAL